jgi:hypothetical protein
MHIKNAVSWIVMVVISYSYHKLDKNWELIGIVGKSCKMLQVVSAIHCQQFVTGFIGDPISHLGGVSQKVYGIW